MEAGSADALRVVADIGDRLGGVEAELHTRLDSELLYTKKKVEQTHELLSSRIDNEILVLSERVEHLRQGTATIDSGLCRLDSKMDQTAEALNNRIEDNATKLDDQIYSGASSSASRLKFGLACLFCDIELLMLHPLAETHASLDGATAVSSRCSFEAGRRWACGDRRAAGHVNKGCATLRR